jgi:hypothetical protein
MKAASIIGFIVGLLIIALVVLANAAASTRWYDSGDREPCIEDRLIRLRPEQKRHVSLDNRRSLGHVWDRLTSLDETTAKRRPKVQPLDNRQGVPFRSGDPDGTGVRGVNATGAGCGCSGIGPKRMRVCGASAAVVKSSR